MDDYAKVIRTIMIRPPCRLIVTLWTLPLLLHLAFAAQQQQQLQPPQSQVSFPFLPSSSSSAKSSFPGSSSKPSPSSSSPSSLTLKSIPETTHPKGDGYLASFTSPVSTANHQRALKSTEDHENAKAPADNNVHDSTSDHSDGSRTLPNNINSPKQTKHQSHIQNQQQLQPHSSKIPSSSKPPPPASKNTISKKDKEIVDAVEKLFLKKAGLSRRPKLDSNFAVPQYMLDLYKTQSERPGGPSSFVALKGRGLIEANTVRTIFHDDIATSRCQPPSCSRVAFDLTNVPEEETLTAAELRIYVDGSPESAQEWEGRSRSAQADDGAVTVTKQKTPPSGASFKQRIEIHEIMRPVSGDKEAISRLIDIRTIYPRHNRTWQSFDIHPAVLRWKRGPKYNYGLEIRLFPSSPSSSSTSPSPPSSSSAPPGSHHVRVRRSADLTDSEWAQQRPFLVTFTNDGSSSPDSSSSSSSKSRQLRRMRRSNRNRNRKKRKRNRRKKNRRRRRKKKGNKNMCKRHAMYVDFAELMWTDWIIAPPGYQANYCHGDCIGILPSFVNASNHAIMQAQVYRVNPSAVPMVCCVPIKLSPISMLYKNEKGIVVMKNYQDMIVNECGCK